MPSIFPRLVIFSAYALGVRITDNLMIQFYHDILPTITIYHNKGDSAIHDISQRMNLRYITISITEEERQNISKSRI